MSSGVEIIGTGHAAPERRVTSAEIEAKLGLEAGWIARRTGILARRYASDGEAVSDLAVAAGEQAIANAGVSRGDIGLILLATSTPDHLLPPTAPLVAQRLGLSGAGGIDLAGACAGFLYALAFGAAFAQSHGTRVLVIGANILSRRINPEDRNTSILFSDAAGALLLSPTERDAGVKGVHLTTDGTAYDRIRIPGGGSRAPLASLDDLSATLMVIDDGRAVFAKAVAMMSDAALRALEAAGLTAADVTHFVPHQANMRMMSAVLEKLGIAPERMRTTIAEYGNSSAATIPFTLSATVAEQPYKRGDVVLMTAAGAGLTGGAIVLRW